MGTGAILWLAAGALASANAGKLCYQAGDLDTKFFMEYNRCFYPGKFEPWGSIPPSWDKACQARIQKQALIVYRVFLKKHQENLKHINPKIRRPDDDELIPPEESLLSFFIDSKICDGTPYGYESESTKTKTPSH